MCKIFDFNITPARVLLLLYPLICIPGYKPDISLRWQDC